MKGLAVGRWLRSALAIAVVFLVASPGRADFIPLPVKWSQPIVDVGGGPFDPGDVIFGVDWLSDHLAGTVRAEDFISDGRPIVAVRWWGSYIATEQVRHPDGFTGPFDISFHDSDANTATFDNHPFSLPTTLLALHTVTAQEVFVGTDVAGEFVYRYDAYLPTPFHEVAGHEYFIDIDKPTQENWGWHETFHVLDWSAVAPGHAGPWSNQQNVDLAFELLTVPEPGTLAVLGLGLVGFVRRRRSTPV